MEWRHAASSANRMIAVAIALVSVVFVLLVANAFSDTGTVKVGTVNTPPLAAQSLASLPSTLSDEDTDNDGLADWEELLWDTDPENPDSDGDGVLDGTQRTNELNDHSSNSGAFAQANPGPIKPLTATDAVAQELFGSYMQAFAGNQNLDAARQQFLVDKAIERAKQFVEVSSYDEKDVQVVPRTLAAQMIYGNTVKGILRDLSRDAPPEYTALAGVTQGDRPQALSDLREAAAVYRTYIAKLKQVPVTNDVVRMHVVLVRALESYATVLGQIASIEIDPLLGAAGVAQFQIAQQGMMFALEKIIAYTQVVEAYINDPESFAPESEQTPQAEDELTETI